MPVICNKCSVSIKRSNGLIKCSKCNADFHPECSKYGKKVSEDETADYVCENCSDDGVISFTSAMEKVQKDVSTLMESLKSLQSLGSKVAENERSIKKCQNEISYLNHDVEKLLQRERQRNVVVTGVPYKNNESVTEIVTKICKCLNITLNNSSIEKCSRFNAIGGGIKPILVVFNSIHDRDLLLSAYKMKKTILSTDIGCEGTNKIHVGEHLTKLQRVLLTQAKRDLIESSMYKYLWIQNNSILVRKNGDSKIQKIKSLSDIILLKRT